MYVRDCLYFALAAAAIDTLKQFLLDKTPVTTSTGRQPRTHARKGLAYCRPCTGEVIVQDRSGLTRIVRGLSPPYSLDVAAWVRPAATPPSLFAHRTFRSRVGSASLEPRLYRTLSYVRCAVELGRPSSPRACTHCTALSHTLRSQARGESPVSTPVVKGESSAPVTV